MSVDKIADEEAIRRWHQEVQDASNAGDFEAYASHWADDMIWMPPHMPPMPGKESCMGMFSGFVDNYEVDQKVTIEEIVVSGDIAFSRFFSMDKLTAKSDGSKMAMDNKNIFIFKRQSDGSWLGTHGIWNTND